MRRRRIAAAHANKPDERTRSTRWACLPWRWDRPLAPRSGTNVKALKRNAKRRQGGRHAAGEIALFDDVGYIPLHQQALAWGVSKKVHVIQRPDNAYIFAWVNMD